MHYLKLLRPHQYIKNLFIFAPLFFSLNFFNLTLFFECMKAFVIFCLTASSVYIFNDIQDIDLDKNHPQKKQRPLASNKISITKAYIISLFLISISFIGAFFINKIFAFLIALYVLINILYSIKLKHIAILDLFIISIGFVLRVIAGGVVAHTAISHWIVIMTFLIAVFIALSKRYNDLTLGTTEIRKSIKEYDLNFASQSMVFLASIIFVSYLLYSLSPDIIKQFKSEHIYITSIFVLYGFLRYFQITFVKKISGEPTKVFLKDKPIITSVLLWLIVFAVLIY